MIQKKIAKVVREHPNEYRKTLMVTSIPRYIIYQHIVTSFSDRSHTFESVEYHHTQQGDYINNSQSNRQIQLQPYNMASGWKQHYVVGI